MPTGASAKNIVRPHLLYCDFDEFTSDNSYNQAIRATLDVSRPWLRSSSGHRLWLEAHARREVEALRRDRTTAHYEPVLGWCELLLSSLNPTLRSGDASAPGPLFEMNRLFEGYVHHVESHAAAPDEEVVEQGRVA